MVVNKLKKLLYNNHKNKILKEEQVLVPFFYLYIKIKFVLEI